MVTCMERYYFELVSETGRFMTKTMIWWSGVDYFSLPLRQEKEF